MEGRSLAVVACAAIALAAIASNPVAAAEPEGHRVIHWDVAGEEGRLQDVVGTSLRGTDNDNARHARTLLSDDDHEWDDDDTNRHKVVTGHYLRVGDDDDWYDDDHKYGVNEHDDSDDGWGDGDDKRKLLWHHKYSVNEHDDSDDGWSDGDSDDGWSDGDDKRKLLWHHKGYKFIGKYADDDDSDDTIPVPVWSYGGAFVGKGHGDDTDDKRRKLLGRRGIMLPK